MPMQHPSHELNADDQKVFSWLCGTEPPPPEHDTSVFHQILAFHRHSGPVNV